MSEPLPPERDDYGTRLDGSRNLWVARIVRAPVVEHANGRWTHGGQIEARTCPTRLAALAVARNMHRFYRMEVQAGARVVIEAGFYSQASMPGVQRRIVSGGEFEWVDPKKDTLAVVARRSD